MDEMNDILTNKSKFPKDNPFDVPEGYFEALEDRIEALIDTHENIRTPRQKVIQMIKPLLGLAASFAVAFLLIYYPLGKILPRYTTAQTEEQTDEYNLEDEFIANTNHIDDNSFFQALNYQENNPEFETEEIINFLSSELDDYEIYAEITN